MHEFYAIQQNEEPGRAPVTESGQQPCRSCCGGRMVFAIAGTIILCVVGALVFQFWSGSRLPLDSPVPMMYRTEAQMQSLVSAIEKHHNMHGEYPPSGIEGQQAAVDTLNATVVYLTELPRDAWNRHFVYVRADDYNVDSRRAVRDSRSATFYNPGTYQLYSLGMDGGWVRDDNRADSRSPNRDNVNNWDRARSWRRTYRERQREYQPDDRSEQ